MGGGSGKGWRSKERREKNQEKKKESELIDRSLETNEKETKDET